MTRLSKVFDERESEVGRLVVGAFGKFEFDGAKKTIIDIPEAIKHVFVDLFV
jgi:hypothetical protein